MDELNDLRTSIDNIDAALLALLAERFRVTEKVGYYKKEHGLPAKDPEREKLQYARLAKLAEQANLDPLVAQKIWEQIIAEVVARHQAIARR